MSSTSFEENTRAFRRTVWAHYRKHGRRALPWRATKDPWRILVSEVMLQQTRVERVIPFYLAFIKRFPTARKLSEASLSEVLTLWQGLGYNRRAKMLQMAAKELVTTPPSGTRSNLVEELEKLPGVGPYTARAVAVFALNQDGILIETNIRTAVIHHFFPKKRQVPDEDIERVLRAALPKGRAREWYWALMDYGAHLKRSGVRVNTRSKGYTRQAAFKGSLREVRGAILRVLAQAPCSRKELDSLFDASRKVEVDEALGALQQEGMVQKRGKVFTLPR